MKRSIDKIVCRYTGVPACAVNPEGVITAASTDIDEVFLYNKVEGANIFALTATKYKDYVAVTEGAELPLLERNGRTFKIVVNKVSDEDGVIIFFKDRTNFENLKKRYNNERTCMAIVHIDNYDELESVTDDAAMAGLETEIDRRIRQWGKEMKASVTRYKDDMYLAMFEQQYYQKLKENRFEILDDIREVETEADFPVTLSIGIGIGSGSIENLDQDAQDALDLALGRGGGQAVVKRGQVFEYYGGRTKAVESNNKGKSRIILYAYMQLVKTASNVIIMGHKKPDMDVFGAALGIHRLTKDMCSNVYIVLNDLNETLSDVIEQAKETEEYEFINEEKALELMDEETVVVYLDNHRLSMADAPKVIEAAERLVIIDHHRRAEDMVDADLINIEPYASSTSELVTEMLQFADAKKKITNLEADALLGGLTVDTNRFAVQTGVRTFEAASWLRRAGADTSSVKRLFRIDDDTFKLRAQTIANAKIENGIATAVCDVPNVDAQIIDSQVADELLTVKSVKASFVAGTDASGQTVVSARSLGEINVQTVMEKLGGGGHLTTAGTQLIIPPAEAIEEIKKILAEEEI